MSPGRDADNMAARVLKLAGRVDVNQARSLHQEVMALHDQGHDVMVDWTQVTALDAAALQILLAFKLALQAAGRRLDVTEPSAAVVQSLALAGVSEIFSRGKASP